MKETITKIIEEIQQKHHNDPTISVDLEKIEAILVKNITETIACLNELSENEISWISSCFETVSAKLQSKEFITCLKQLVKKYPNIKFLREDVQDAIDVIE